MKKLLKLDMGTLSELLQKLFSSQSAPLKYPAATVVYNDLNYLQQVFQSPVSSNSWFPVTENTSWHSGYAWLCADCMRSFAQEKKSQQAPEIDALVRDRKVFAWCHKIN